MNYYRRITFLLITILIGCNMETNNINNIEELLNYKFKYNIEETHYEYWKPNEELAYSYTISKIKISQEQYNLLVNDLENKNDYEYPKFKLNWTIPDEFDVDWWNPEPESLTNMRYNSFENGWIQIKYEKGYTYILKTIN